MLGPIIVIAVAAGVTVSGSKSDNGDNQKKQKILEKEKPLEKLENTDNIFYTYKII